MTTNLLAVIFYIICLSSSILCAKFPQDITRCTGGDSKCVMEVANYVLHNFKEGHKALNLVPIDPLSINGIRLKQGSNSPVNIELIFSDVQLQGLSDCTITKFTGYAADTPQGEYEINLKCPVLYLVGPYIISGRVLVLPIQGEGASNMTLYNPDITVKYTGSIKTKNDKEYLMVENLKLSFGITRLYMRLDNLYRGDKLLGDSTNLFLNENWDVIFNELKQNIFDAFSLIIENVLNNVHAKFPYKDIFV